MKKYIFLIWIGLCSTLLYAQKIEIKDSTLVILNAYSNEDEVYVTDSVFAGLRRIIHTGNDLKVETFDMWWKIKGNLMSINSITRINPKYIEKILADKVEKVFFSSIRIKLKDRFISTSFILHIKYL